MKISRYTAEHYIWGEHCDGWHLVNTGDLSVIYEKMPPYTAEVRHIHASAKQFFFVLKGRAQMETNGEFADLGPEEGIEILPGTPHQMMNNSEEDVEFIVVSAPNSKGDRTAV